MGEGQWLVHNSGRCPPFGFLSAGQFSQFSGQLYAGFRRAGYGESEFFVQGSAVTGRSHSTGDPFDVGRVSDIDVAVVNPAIIERLTEAGYRVKSDGNVVLLLPEQLEFLGLSDLAAAMSKTYGRPVNFQVYTSVEGVKKNPNFRILNPKP